MFNDLFRHSGPRFARHGMHGGFGGGFGGRGLGGHGFGGHEVPFGRKMGSDDLRVVILALLAEGPAHGYELIKTIEDRSGGFYTPSPGMIYPALTYLSETGHTSVEQEGTRKLYRITDEGLQFLNGNRASADRILSALSRIGGRMDDVREAFAGFGDGEPGASDDFHHARRALKEALRRKRGCDAEEARRVAAILIKAAADINAGAPVRR